MKIKIVDSIMGSGKTKSAINKMNEDWNNNYIFITPYLNEVSRIKDECSNRKFYEPDNKGNGKLDSLHNLIAKQHSIASTHSLFKIYNDYTKELIRLNNYVLILDEVFDVLEIVPLHKDDVGILLESGLAHLDENSFVIWDDKDYNGTKFNAIKSMSESKNLILINGVFMVWNFPIDVFESFKEVYILTYMFNAQVQKYYYDINNVEYAKLGVAKKEDGTYSFSDEITVPEYVKDLKSKITIIEDDKLNAIGDGKHSLSKSWFRREQDKRSKPMFKMLKNNIINTFIHKTKTNSNTNMWTTFKDYKGSLAGKGYTKGFVACNARATNEYGHKKSLAYCLNVYFNPYIKNYFVKNGIEVQEDMYALSELIQWVWRSAIRNGDEITLYIPSSRMRGLLKDFLNGFDE